MEVVWMITRPMDEWTSPCGVDRGFDDLKDLEGAEKGGAHGRMESYSVWMSHWMTKVVPAGQHSSTSGRYNVSLTEWNNNNRNHPLNMYTYNQHVR